MQACSKQAFIGKANSKTDIDPKHGAMANKYTLEIPCWLSRNHVQLQTSDKSITIVRKHNERVPSVGRESSFMKDDMQKTRVVKSFNKEAERRWNPRTRMHTCVRVTLVGDCCRRLLWDTLVPHS